MILSEPLKSPPPPQAEAIQLRNSTFNAKEYEIDVDYKEAQSPSECTTIRDLLKFVVEGKTEIDARVLSVRPDGKKVLSHYPDSKSFLEAWKKGEKEAQSSRLRESFAFDTDVLNSGLVGFETIPLLGGPFYKQLYYTDYIKMHNLCFYASNHDPIARFIINTVRDFTMGRGFKIESDNKAALALWRAFEKANNLHHQMYQLAGELETYGETMVWKLPNNNVKIIQAPSLDEPVPKGLIPRVRLIDPSVIWDIVTWPEDITNVLYYTWVSPTQWQTYTGLSKEIVPTSKFIFQTIPADQMLHYKINAVSNEKRGRSDLFSVLGYLKRLRDSVNYSIISLQKQAAWSIDTSIEGSQADIDAYVNEQQSIGTIAPVGSEFVHTNKITRTMIAPSVGSKGNSSAFEWTLSMIAAGTGIPISYFGSHLSGGQTRASAMIATEPTAKKFEMRQQIYKNILQDLWDYCMESFGIKAECEIILPEIVTQDRSAKLKDLAIAQSQGWISKRKASEIAAKELQIENFKYDEQKEELQEDPPPQKAPLSTPGIGAKPTGVTSEDRQDVKQNRGF